MVRFMHCSLVCIILSITPAFATAQITSFSEDFTTLDHCDTTLTTAEWDPVAGEVRLPPFEISLAGSYGPTGTVDQVQVRGDHAFLAGHHFGLVVVDITDPTAPTLAGSFVTPGLARDVALAGDQAYVAGFQAGLVVLDISDPTVPVQVGVYDTPGYAEDVAVSGNHAYVADVSADCVDVFDISDPKTPEPVGRFVTDGACQGLLVTGDLLYACADVLHIIDVSDPSTPLELGRYDGTDSVADVAVAGNHAYVADNFQGLQVIDVTDTTSPVLVGSVAVPATLRGVEVTGDRAYLADGAAGLLVVDISDPTNPSILTSQVTSDQAQDLVIAGKYAYVADHLAGLQVVQIAELTEPVFLAQGSTNGYAFSVALSGDRAYIANYTNPIAVMDISDPAAPTWVSEYDPPTSVIYDVAVAGDVAYFTGSWQLCAFDIRDPDTLVLLDWIVVAGASTGYGLALSGDHAYVANSWGDLQVFDISDPSALAHVTSLTLSDQCLDVDVDGDIAVVGTASDGLRVIDVSDPATPTILGTYGILDEINGVTIEGDYAYLAGEAGRFVVVDISDPASPSPEASRTVSGQPQDIVVVGDHAYVAASSFSLHRFDITNPANPVAGPTWETYSYAYGIAATGDHVYLAHGGRGLVLIQTMNSSLDTSSGFVQSRYYYFSQDVPLITSLTETVNTPGLAFELSWDNGANWQSAAGSGIWEPVVDQDRWLKWRTDLVYTPPLNPTVTNLRFDWRYDFPIIASVTDIAADQGGMVRVNILRSGYDFAPAQAEVVSSYNVLRRLDAPLLKAELAGAPVDRSSGLPIRELGGRRFVDFGAAADKADLPDGAWEILGSFNAMQQDSYVFPAATLADSGATVPWSAYCVTAHTTDPLTWYVSPPDSGYSVDNIAPGAPQGVAAHYAAGGVDLDWDDAPEEDFQFFRVYRGPDPGFVASPANLVGETAASAWLDGAADPWDHHYKVSTVDDAGNESPAAAPQTVSEVPRGAVTARTALLDAVPNPFNPSTRLAFTLAAPARARLRVYDAAGRLVATLCDARRAAGRHEIVWDGRTDAGRPSAAGVYLYRLEAGGHVETKRMVLVK